jgi:hypothetical protein
MNRKLAKAVIASFRDEDRDTHHGRFASFDDYAWKSLYGWLDASGLAIYLLERIRTLRLEAALPASVLHRLERNASDNRGKTSQMREEFFRVNLAFQKARLSYVNLKGFTLVPDACPDACLRCQFDLDFLVDSADVSRCEEVLRELGYRLAGNGNNVKEFKVGGERLPSVNDLYKAKPQRAVEIHFAEPTKQRGMGRKSEMLSRRLLRKFDGSNFPVVSDSDKFVGLSFHLFKHLSGEWTRASWILEYANFIDFHQDDEELWREAEKWAASDSELRAVIGASAFIAHRIFGSNLSGTLAEIVQQLPKTSRLWIERYGEAVVVAKFPGTKHYLLLQRSHSSGRDMRQQKGRGKLFPLHLPARIVVAPQGRGLLFRFARMRSELSYFLFRLRFHITQGCSYIIEVPRWKRSIAELNS